MKFWVRLSSGGEEFIDADEMRLTDNSDIVFFKKPRGKQVSEIIITTIHHGQWRSAGMVEGEENES